MAHETLSCIHQVPEEIIEQFAEYLVDDYQSLLACCSASRLFLSSFQSRLFRVVKLPMSERHCQALADILRDAPHLQRMVRTLHLTQQRHKGLVYNPLPSFPLLPVIFSHLPALTSLKLVDLQTHLWFPQTWNFLSSGITKLVIQGCHQMSNRTIRVIIARLPFLVSLDIVRSPLQPTQQNLGKVEATKPQLSSLVLSEDLDLWLPLVCVDRLRTLDVRLVSQKDIVDAFPRILEASVGTLESLAVDLRDNRQYQLIELFNQVPTPYPLRHLRALTVRLDTMNPRWHECLLWWVHAMEGWSGALYIELEIVHGTSLDAPTALWDALKGLESVRIRVGPVTAKLARDRHWMPKKELVKSMAEKMALQVGDSVRVDCYVAH